MKGEHLFASGAPFFRRVYLLGGEELVVLQSTIGETSLGDSFHQITDFNDLPTSLFACNVDQSVFEEQEGKMLPSQASCEIFTGVLRKSLQSYRAEEISDDANLRSDILYWYQANISRESWIIRTSEESKFHPVQNCNTSHLRWHRISVVVHGG
ncbi:hypothetical protein AOLI_G00027840 [Acnodon oligacanthus]